MGSVVHNAELSRRQGDEEIETGRLARPGFLLKEKGRKNMRIPSRIFLVGLLD